MLIKKNAGPHCYAVNGRAGFKSPGRPIRYAALWCHSEDEARQEFLDQMARDRKPFVEIYSVEKIPA